MKIVKNGMSLVEVVISMLLLGLIVTGMYATFSLIGNGPNATSAAQLQAVNYARQTLEQLKNAVSVDSDHASELNAGLYPDTAPPTGFTRSYQVDDETLNGINYKRVTVTVSWPD